LSGNGRSRFGEGGPRSQPARRRAWASRHATGWDLLVECRYLPVIDDDEDFSAGKRGKRTIDDLVGDPIPVESQLGQQLAWSHAGGNAVAFGAHTLFDEHRGRATLQLVPAPRQDRLGCPRIDRISNKNCRHMRLRRDGSAVSKKRLKAS
jgi:hypothetical protein